MADVTATMIGATVFRFALQMQRPLRFPRFSGLLYDGLQVSGLQIGAAQQDQVRPEAAAAVSGHPHRLTANTRLRI